ncbi:MAG: phosphatidylglycerol lysyltransferase domain-containing protein [Candidatus Poribacteria bacterium]|nr:phosphatidylglycerol lysyltransferase domain-containing protein [Candidatus Poribacteria bacterium]
MQLSPLTLEDKPIFDKYVDQPYTPLSNYAFAPLYIWQDYFDLLFTICSSPKHTTSDQMDYLCVYAKHDDDYFMPILPIPCSINNPTYLEVVNKAYQFMIDSNQNPQIARIENVPKEMLSVFNTLGFDDYVKETEYVYSTEEMSELRGNGYKQQRNAYNAFITRYPLAEYTHYQSSHKNACLELYESWRKKRAGKYDDPIYQAMLNDSQSAHRIGITHAEELGLVGRVVRINGQLCAYTFGYELNRDTFCVLFEISDLNKKGLAQFIYREFCKELLGSYKWINAMDDSGLENLKQVKQAYHPKRLIPTYNITKKYNENCTHLS